MESTSGDIRPEHITEKEYAPYCTVNCAHYVGYLDFWLGRQTIPDRRPFEEQVKGPVQIQVAGSR